MKHEIKIEVPTAINRELACLDRKDIKPEKIAILLARQQYPWLDELLTLLTAAAEKNVKHATDQLFAEALTTITTGE